MIVAFIPLRKGSKSIRLKNVKLLAGKPLAQWVIDAANQSWIEKVVVSTDSIFINGLLKDRDVFWRSPETATDTASSELPLIEYCKTCDENDIIVFLQATSPLIKSSEINNGILQIIREERDSVVSVVRQKRFLWGEDGVPEYDLNNRPRRQDHKGILVENGAFYISRAKNILKSGCRVSGRIGLVECSPESYIELDEPTDWIIIETLLKNDNLR